LNFDPNIRKQLNQKLKANKHRALELQRIKKAHDENTSSISLARKIWVSTKQYNNLWFDDGNIYHTEPLIYPLGIAKFPYHFSK
jgi:hypothetical protein